MKKRRTIFLILAVIWMGIIFSFSQRPGTVSTNDSNRIGMLLGSLFVPEFMNWPKEDQLELAKKIDHPIRKTAHALEYALLGGLLLGACWGLTSRKSFTVLIPWGIGSLYAGTDEFHQLFVPGRSGQVSDVILDSTGVLCGILLILIIIKIFHTKSIRNERIK